MGWVSQVACPWTCGLPPPKLVLLTRKPSLGLWAEGILAQGRVWPFPASLGPSWLSWPHRSSWPKPTAGTVTRGEMAGGPSAQREEGFRWFVSRGERRL